MLKILMFLGIVILHNSQLVLTEIQGISIINRQPLFVTIFIDLFVISNEWKIIIDNNL